MTHVESELDIVRERANELGIRYHHKAGVAKIKALIEAHESANEEPPELPERWANYKPMTAAEYMKNKQANEKSTVGALIRVRVTCMNPAKREWPGEYISVGSAKLGTFKKYVPFDGREWHVPRIIYDHMLERKCTVFQDSPRGEKGHQTRVGRLIDEFNIQVLDPLTPHEMDDLAKKQAMAAGQ